MRSSFAYVLIILIPFIIYNFGNRNLKKNCLTKTESRPGSRIGEEPCAVDAEKPKTLVNKPKKTKTNIVPGSVVTNVTDQPCAGGTGILMDTGIHQEDGFQIIYSTCFDFDSQGPFWTKHKISTQKNHKNSSKEKTSRPKFKQDKKVYNTDLKINMLYPKIEQQKNINNSLGLEESDSKFIMGAYNLYFARGHLTSNADFNDHLHRKATFQLHNAVPQFQVLNNGNWKTLENCIRNYSTINNKVLEVLTGGYRIIKWRHNKTEKDVKIFLYKEKEIKIIPVPELMWKIVFDPDTKEGIVLLGLNDIYKEIQNSYICEDISKDVGWLPEDLDKPNKGYCYACSLQDFKEAVGDLIPDFDVKGILM